jgi:hypothetical protein
MNFFNADRLDLISFFLRTISLVEIQAAAVADYLFPVI